MSWQLQEAAQGRYYDRDGRPVDELDRVYPHRLSAAKYLQAGGVLHYFDKRVPATHLNEEVTDDEWFAVIDCVCGPTAFPTIHLGGVVTCPGGCGRAFLYEGAPGIHGRRAVFVAHFPDGVTGDEDDEIA